MSWSHELERPSWKEAEANLGLLQASFLLSKDLFHEPNVFYPGNGILFTIRTKHGLIPVATWVNLRSSALSARSQAQ